MTKNETLSKFLRDKRKKLGKTLQVAAEAVGCCSISQYQGWETLGRLPRDPERQEKMAALLEVTKDELLEKAGIGTEDQQNLIPLIKAIAQCNCQVMSFEDIRFLNETQAALDQPMSPELIGGLMKHRVGPSNGLVTPP
ncbi:MAG: helix-turn-helix domain-containing protein [bacterium]|nr:helix-turn-helix domain-containing protein [bacterium]